MRRGGRNRAREKVWPGQDAAEVRALHESQGEPELRQKNDFAEPAPAALVGAMTRKQAANLKPQSDLARAVRLASAAGTYVLPPLKKRFSASVGRPSRGIRGGEIATLKEVLGEFHWDKIGRAHYLLMLLQAANKFVLPQFMHELDPCEILMMVENMDLGKATHERFSRIR